LPEGALPVDLLFERYYEKLGGIAILGPAISPAFGDSGLIYQYTTNVLLVFNPQGDGNRLSLAPLGRDIGIYEFPENITPEADHVIVDGYLLYDKFLALYNQLGGKPVLGRPLTEAHLNEEKSRIEQYFENAGFYWRTMDPEREIYLLAYGAWKCREACQSLGQENSLVIWPGQSSGAFMQAVANWGLSFTGYALTPPYLASTGQLEQIYENVVLVSEINQSSDASLLSISDRVGITRDILMAPRLLPDYYFYAVEGDLGYNIPQAFIDYVNERGGFEVVGAPITQEIHLENTLVRLCFEKICLEGHKDASGFHDIKPMALGKKYHSLFYRADASAVGSEDVQDLTVQIWEQYPMVAPDQAQEIVVTVFSNNTPLVNIQPELEVLLPDGPQDKITLPPTDQKGEAHWIIEPMQVDNGTLIPYKVCVQTGVQRFCIRDSFLIWKTELTVATPKPVEGHTQYLPFVMKNFYVYIPAVIEQYIFLPLVTK
jgi:hypothetical protein